MLPWLPKRPGTSKVFRIDVGVVGADDHPVEEKVSKCLLLIFTWIGIVFVVTVLLEVPIPVV